MNETFLVFLVFILLLLNIGLFVMIWRMGGKKDDRGNDLLLKQMGELNRTMDAKIGESNRFMNESVSDQFNKSQKLIQDINQNVTEHLVNVTKKMTEANESSKQVFGIAEQLHSLEKVLKHQKQRGTLGETNLELILSNILDPTTYKMQYQFNSGETVDAVIMTKEGIIPIDAKFSLDNYNRITQEDDAERKAVLEKEFRNDLKKRIDETSKYIKTNEGTLPFAFMFIPAEGIYYDLLVNEIGTVKVNSRSLIDYAYNDKKVIIVSPTTFAAYLQSVLYGFKAFKIEESAQEIRKSVGELQKHLKSYEEYHNKIGRTLGTVSNHYNQSGKEFKKIDKDIMRITGSSMDIDTPLLDKPDFEE